jgi:hypothetical protein
MRLGKTWTISIILSSRHSKFSVILRWRIPHQSRNMFLIWDLWIGMANQSLDLGSKKKPLRHLQCIAVSISNRDESGNRPYFIILMMERVQYWILQEMWPVRVKKRIVWPVLATIDSTGSADESTNLSSHCIFLHLNLHLKSLVLVIMKHLCRIMPLVIKGQFWTPPSSLSSPSYDFSVLFGASKTDPNRSRFFLWDLWTGMATF